MDSLDGCGKSAYTPVAGILRVSPMLENLDAYDDPNVRGNAVQGGSNLYHKRCVPCRQALFQRPVYSRILLRVTLIAWLTVPVFLSNVTLRRCRVPGVNPGSPANSLREATI